MTEEILSADLSNTQHADAIIHLLNEYARDIMGGGEDLSDYTKTHLIGELQKRSGVHIVLAFIDGKPAGLANCFEGFSTFACKPLLNIHDITVTPEFRGRGLSKRIMLKVEEVARQLGCCKVTLEVLEGNNVAQRLYESCGYAGYALDPRMGNALFWQKKL
jgi:GNAT superfamily N-acetyltransferase